MTSDKPATGIDGAAAGETATSETVNGATTASAPEAAPQADTAKVQIQRVPGVEPITCITYTPFRNAELDNAAHSRGAAHWQPAEGVDVFEVSADIAAAAVESGGFEVTPDSRVQLKGGAA